MERIVINTYNSQTNEIRNTDTGKKKTRVAAYCRVSTDKEEQQTSFNTQCTVYTDMINTNPDWTLAGIYTDEGITGTSTKNRKGFQKMIADCEEGRIDLIVTKSISRFARNTLDCLSTVRYLQSLGVNFIFEKEHIDTRAAFSEMLLTIMAAFAQEESRSISENLKWGIRKRFENGEARWNHCYGFRSFNGVDYIIEPAEAEAVALIFDMYQHGKKINEIIEELYSRNIPSPKGKDRWLSSGVYDVLKNEKYVGDIILQKKYTTDHISHKQIKNTGVDVPAYYIRDHHNPIVSRKTFDQVSKIRKMRYQGTGRDNPGCPVLYPFGTNLKCPLCGGTLIRRQLPVQKREVGWICETCFSFILKEDILISSMMRAYEEISIPAVTRKLKSKRKHISDQAQLLIQTKEKYNKFNTVEFFWLDDLVDKILIGSHTTKENGSSKEEDNHIITVCWKCGVKTTVPTGILSRTDDPTHVAELYTSYYIRNKKEIPCFKL